MKEDTFEERTGTGEDRQLGEGDWLGYTCLRRVRAKSERVVSRVGDGTGQK